MGPQETPPSSPYMEEDVIEEIDDNALVDDDIDVLEAIYVEEADDDDAGEEMAEEGDIVEAMEREDAVCIFEKHIGKSVFCGSLSSNAELAVTGGEDDKAYIWNTKTAEVIMEISDHKDSVIFAGFSHDDRYLATGDMGGFIQVRNTSDRAVIWDYSMNDITWMQWHPVAYVLLAGSVEGEVYMWKIPDGECKVVQGFGKRTECSALMPDGKRIIVGYEDGIIRVIDLKSCTVSTSIPANAGHTGAITSIDCHKDNNLFISAAVDGKTILNSANTGRVINILQDLRMDNSEVDDPSGSEGAKENWVEAVAFIKDETQQLAATGTVNGDIFIWENHTLRHRIDQGSGITKLVWKENSPLLFSAGLDGIVRCYDGRSGEMKRTFLGHTEDILDICLSKDGKYALTTSDDATARIFKIDEPRPDSSIQFETA